MTSPTQDALAEVARVADEVAVKIQSASNEERQQVVDESFAELEAAIKKAASVVKGQQ
jgi:hypothetical protein